MFQGFFVTSLASLWSDWCEKNTPNSFPPIPPYWLHSPFHPPHPRNVAGGFVLKSAPASELKQNLLPNVLTSAVRIHFNLYDLIFRIVSSSHDWMVCITLTRSFYLYWSSFYQFLSSPPFENSGFPHRWCRHGVAAPRVPCRFDEGVGLRGQGYVQSRWGQGYFQ